MKKIYFEDLDRDLKIIELVAIDILDSITLEFYNVRYFSFNSEKI